MRSFLTIQMVIYAISIIIIFGFLLMSEVPIWRVSAWTVWGRVNELEKRVEALEVALK